MVNGGGHLVDTRLGERLDEWFDEWLDDRIDAGGGCDIRRLGTARGLLAHRFILPATPDVERRHAASYGQPDRKPVQGPTDG
ncbi:hypothetical protein BA895_04120 [Humibacillus sp. DSM 29435]|nr:hypothetical protein BA895_04120 [Humibacillus sp. DSM 29435]